ncbi:MAG: molecular chaperone HtpG [Hyphomicrobiaceae bacterium]
MTEDVKSATTQPFQTEVARLLHLMVHAVYTDKEIFLRELISNASDACDKLRYEAITTPDLLGGDKDGAYAITLSPDAQNGWLEISDNGIGMTADEMTENLGTIARSGTKAFLDKLQEQPDGANLIGQFGVGFYSAFMVADHIEVISRKAGTGGANVWTSDGASGFTIEPASDDQAARVPRGTVVRLKLKSDAKEFTDSSNIERIVKTYSDHILFPVMLRAGEEEARQLNGASALWQRSASDVSKEEYGEAYRTLTNLFDEPAMTVHYKAEGRQSFAVLLFVPEQPPFDLFDAERRGRVKLYVRRVFITDDAEVLPGYLRFVRGVVDSEDVPLNISREMLQNNPMVAQIRKALTKRVLGDLAKLADKDKEAYAKVWSSFGSVLKEGIYEDGERRQELLKLARFRTTAGEDLRSLADYVADLKENQTEVYYLAGQDLARLQASPQLESAKAKGIEVLLLTDPIDHYWTTQGVDFDGKPLKSLSQGDLDLSTVQSSGKDDKDDANSETENAGDDGAQAGEGFIAKLKEALGDQVSDVRASKRLVDSAVCLVASNMGPDLGLEKILAQHKQALGLKPVLEVNTGHVLVKAIAQQAAAGDKEAFSDLAGLLLDQAFVLDGQTPEDPAAFAARMNKVMLQQLGRS